MEHGKRPEEFLELLIQLVLVKQSVVTATYILRHTPLDVFQTQKLLKQFLDSNSNVTATYYLLGPPKDEIGKKHCAIVREEELDRAKRCLAKVDICSIFSVQSIPIESLDDVFKADWIDQKLPMQLKGFLINSEAEKALNILDKNEIVARKRHKCLSNQSDCSGLSPISLPKDNEDMEEVGEGEAENNAVQKKVDEHRPSGKGKSEKEAKNLFPAHPPTKRPMAQLIKRESKAAKTKATSENGGSKQTTIFNFFKK